MSEQRLLGLVEEAMPTASGHWQPYTFAVAKGFKERGWYVRILGSGSADGPAGIRIEKVFARSIWNNPLESLRQPARFLAKFTFPWMWSREMQTHLENASRYSLLYAPNQLPAHLLAWSLVLASKSAHRVPCLALGVNFFGRPGGAPPTLLFWVQALMAKLFLAGKVRRGRVHFFCENKTAQDWLSNFFGWPFTLLPHPVECARRPLAHSSKRDVHFLALGFARPDKGSDILQQAIAAVLKRQESDNLRFTLQWGDERSVGPFAMLKDAAAASSPQVTYLDSVLSAEQIDQLLAQADSVILPYRNSAYYARLSRVAVEAVSCGLPVIYPRNSSIAEIVSEQGAGVDFEDGDVNSLADAIMSSARNLEQLRALSRQRKDAAQTYHSGITLANLVEREIKFF